MKADSNMKGLKKSPSNFKGQNLFLSLSLSNNKILMITVYF